MATVITQWALAERLVKGNRQSPEPLRLAMCSRHGAGPHHGVRLGRDSLGVRVEAPVPELEAREEAPLGAGVEGLPADD